ncbi:unnamed protein product [Sphagnum tenellum]
MKRRNDDDDDDQQRISSLYNVDVFCCVIKCAREIDGILARAAAGLQERAANVTTALQARWMTGATVYRPSHTESGSFSQMLSTQGDDPCKSSSWSR